MQTAGAVLHAEGAEEDLVPDEGFDPAQADPTELEQLLAQQWFMAELAAAEVIVDPQYGHWQPQAARVVLEETSAPDEELPEELPEQPPEQTPDQPMPEGLPEDAQPDAPVEEEALPQERPEAEAQPDEAPEEEGRAEVPDRDHLEEAQTEDLGDSFEQTPEDG